MARIEVDPNYSSPTFSRATAATDPFKKEDVQGVAAALSTHVHDGVHGLAIAPPAGSVNGSVITDGTITSAKIADGTIVAADIASGTITSNEIADGTIATADLANASVTNAKLASDTARANLLTNGGFEVWQRGNGVFGTQGTFTADRWAISLAGTDTISVSKDTTNKDTKSGACAAGGFNLSGGAGSSALYQALKLSDGYPVGGMPLSASVRVNTAAAAAGVVQLRIYDLTNSVTVASANNVSTSGYQTLACTGTPAASCQTVFFGMWFQASISPFYFDNAMLVVGSQPADYAPLHPADDLTRCLRYYEKVTGYLGAQGHASGAGSPIQIMFMWKAIKAVVPTVTVPGGFTTSNCGQPVANSPDQYSMRMYGLAVAAGQTLWELNPANVTTESNP